MMTLQACGAGIEHVEVDDPVLASGRLPVIVDIAVAAATVTFKADDQLGYRSLSVFGPALPV